MDSNNITLNLIFEVPDSQLYEVKQQQQKLVAEGALGLYELKEYNTVVLKLHNWQYTLQKNIPILSQKQNTDNTTYILPSQGGSNFGVIFKKETSKELIECFESILQTNADFRVTSTPGQPENEKEVGQKPAQKKSASEQIGSGLAQLGGMLKTGLIVGGTYAGQGIVKGGQYIEKKIQKKEPTEVKPETMMKVKGAKVASQACVVYTKVQVEALVMLAKEIGKGGVEMAEQSETGQKYKDNKYVEGAKNVGKGAIYCAADVFDGMYQALCLVGRGTQTATTGVVNHRYGEQAGKAVNEGMDCVGNIGTCIEATEVAVVNGIVKTKQSEEQKKAD